MAQREDPQATPRGDLGFLAAGLGAASALPAMPPVHENGPTRFESKFRGHRLLVKVGEQINPLTGQPMIGPDGKPIAHTEDVQFIEHAYQTENPKIVAALRRHRQFGADFWDATERKAAQRRQAAEALLSDVETLPEDIKDALRAKLGVTDFALPPAEVPGAAPPAV
jgi:hypothetical protein